MFDVSSAISLTAVGLFVLSSYSFHIDYFPLFDLQAASSYLFAATLVTLLLLLLVATIVLVPYFFMATTLKPRKAPNTEQKLSASITIWSIFNMLTLASWSAAYFLTLVLGWSAGWCLPIMLLFISLLSGIRTRFYAKKICKKYHRTLAELSKKKAVRKIFIGQLGIAFLSSVLQLAPLSMLFLIFSQASRVPERDYLTYWSTSTICAFFIALVGGMFLHIALIPRYRRFWRFALAVILVLPFWLSGLSEATGMLPMTMARLTKIGNFHAEKLILAPKACGSVAPLLGMNCDEKTSPPLQLCNVHIMSRIGPETYLHIADRRLGQNGKYAIRRIFIPTSDITSMQVNFDTKIERLSDIDAGLSSRSSACDRELTTLHADSAFSFNDFMLTDSGRSQLLSFVEAVEKGAASIKEVKVTGHADHIGRDDRNEWLAERRAQEVKIFMDTRLKNAVPPIKVTATSKGSTHPLTKACDTLALKERIKCEAPNRRVELEIIAKEPAKTR